MGFAALFFLKMPLSFLIYFSERLGMEREWLAWGMFLLGILWHGIFLALSSTQTTRLEGNFETMYEKARLAFLNGNNHGALLIFEQMHRVAPQDEDVIYQLGKIYLEIGKMEHAKKLFGKYLSGQKAKKLKWEQEVRALITERALA
jgi:hypothetical protein